MRLTSMDIKHLGPYQSSSIQFHRDGLQVLYGPNETGKSTLLAAIRGGLFGQARMAEGSVAVRSGSSVRLGLENDRGEMVMVDRVLSKKSPPIVQYANGHRATGQAALLDSFPELKGIEQLLFEAFFTVQLADLVSFSEHPQAVSQVFGIRAPLLNPYLFEDKMDKKARDIYLSSSRATRPLLNRLQREYQQAQRNLAEYNDGRAWYERTELERNRLDEESQGLFEQQRKLQEKRAFYRQCVELQPQVDRFITIEEQLKALGDCPSGRFEWWASADQLMDEVNRLATQIESLNNEASSMENRIRDLAQNGAWLHARSAVTRVHSDVQRAIQVLSSLQGAKSEVDERRRALVALTFVMPDEWTEADLQSCAAQNDDWKALFDAAETCEKYVDRVRATTDRLRVETEICTEHQDEFQKLAGFGGDDVDEAIADFANRKSDMERRLDKVRDDVRGLERLDAQSADLRDTAANSNGRQSTPFFVAAILLLAGSVFNFSNHLPWGGIAFVIAAAVVGAFPFVARFRRPSVTPTDVLSMADLRNAPREGETIRSMLDRLRGEEDEMKRTLQAWVSASRVLDKWQTSMQQIRVMEAELRAQQASLQDAETHYAKCLNRVRLSYRTFTSSDIMHFSHHAAEYLRAQQSVTSALHRAAALQVDLKEVLSRMASTISVEVDTLAVHGTDMAKWLLEQSESPAELKRPLDALASLCDEWFNMVDVAHQENVERAKSVEQRERLRSDAASATERLNALRDDVAAIYRELGVPSHEAYLEFMTREKKRMQLFQERLRLLDDLILASGGEHKAAAVVGRVKKSSAEALEQNMRHADEDYDEISGRIHKLQEDIWKLGHELEASQINTDGTKQRFELARLEAAMDEAQKSYVSHLLAKSVSKWARVNVESTQTLPVLELASTYLAQLTDMRYRSLFIPLGDDAMKRMQVEDKLGYKWPMDALSRGTRELVYLALRIAVVREYRTKGVILPVVLDDPLVNFDDARAKRVFDLLCAEASLQPMIYLTCHKRFIDVLSSDSRVHMVQRLEEGRALAEVLEGEE